MSDNELYLMKNVVLEARLWEKLGKAKIETFFGVSELIALAVDSFDFTSIANKKDRTRKAKAERKTPPYQRFFDERNQRELQRIKAKRKEATASESDEQGAK